MIYAMVENNVSVDKFEKRAVIKYLFLKGLYGKAIHDDMLVTLGDNARAYSVVKSWLAEFKRGRNSVEDGHRSERPRNAASIENVQIVDDMLKEDRRLTIRHIAETTDIHATAVYRVVSDDLDMKKANRVDVCTDLLCCLQAQPQFFLERTVMQDETWVHHFDPETKRQSMV